MSYGGGDVTRLNQQIKYLLEVSGAEALERLIEMERKHSENITYFREQLEKGNLTEQTAVAIINSEVDARSKLSRAVGTLSKEIQDQRSATEENIKTDKEWLRLQEALGAMEARDSLEEHTKKVEKHTEAVRKHNEWLTDVYELEPLVDQATQTRIVTTGRATEVTEKHTKASDASEKSQRQNRMAVIELGRAFEDFSVAGPIGAINNINRLTEVMVGSAGLVAGITVATTAAYLLWRNWDRVKESFGGNELKEVSDDLDGLKDRLKQIEEKKIRLAIDPQEFDRAQERVDKLMKALDAFKAAEGKPTGGASAVGAVISEAITEEGGGPGTLVGVIEKIQKERGGGKLFYETDEEQNLREFRQRSIAQLKQLPGGIGSKNVMQMENLIKGAEERSREHISAALGMAAQGDKSAVDWLQKMFMGNRLRFAEAGVGSKFGAAVIAAEAERDKDADAVKIRSQTEDNKRKTADAKALLKQQEDKEKQIQNIGLIDADEDHKRRTDAAALAASQMIVSKQKKDADDKEAKEAADFKAEQDDVELRRQTIENQMHGATLKKQEADRKRQFKAAPQQARQAQLEGIAQEARDVGYDPMIAIALAKKTQSLMDRGINMLLAEREAQRQLWAGLLQIENKFNVLQNGHVRRNGPMNR